VAATRVSLIGELYECVRPLFEGSVALDAAQLVVTRCASPEAMRRQLTAWEFDVCEMAFGAYLIARAGGADVTAIPVFPRRAFFHTNFFCSAQAQIESPRDLASRRVGVPEYVQSATVWARGVLEHDFGLDGRSVTWYVERAGANSTGEVLDFRPPADVEVRQTPGGMSLRAMLAAGELDAALIGASPTERTGGALRPLFCDPIAEGQRFCAAHGYVPANHLYMIRGELARRQPELLAHLYGAFAAAKALARASLPPGAATGLLFGNLTMARGCESLAGDPFAYGIGANRAMLEAVLQRCVEQGLVPDAPPLEQLFVPGIE
jgi:4,5-dihydroxyphthalate decarboxylase